MGYFCINRTGRTLQVKTVILHVPCLKQSGLRATAIYLFPVEQGFMKKRFQLRTGCILQKSTIFLMAILISLLLMKRIIKKKSSQSLAEIFHTPM